MRKLIELIQSGIGFYLKSFYSPTCYRNVVFRDEGYGLKRLFIFFVIMLIPSYLVMMGHLFHLYQKVWSDDLKPLPVLILNDGKLSQLNQNIVVKPDQQLFGWLPSDNTKDILDKDKKFKYYLGTKFLWAKMPLSHTFGFSFIQFDYYVPILQWQFVDFPVFGPNIYKALSKNYLVVIFAMFYLMVTISGFFYLFIFIRSFGIIARRMVSFVLNYTLEYAQACRLLSLSAIPTITFIVIICDLGLYQDIFKYLFIFIYMFYFYLGVRFIRASSSYKWVAP